MSRSYKRIGVSPWTTSESEKSDKIIANRRFRRRVTHALKKGRYSRLPFKMREVSNIYSWDKDGKVLHNNISSKTLVLKNDKQELHKWYRRK